MIEKFTPGPWIGMVDGEFIAENPWSLDHEEGNSCTHAAIGCHDGYSVALVISDDDRPGKDRWDYSEIEANAHLITSAPDLYADLKTAAAQLRKYEKLHRAKGTADSFMKAEVNAELASRFEATLAKARGEV